MQASDTENHFLLNKGTEVEITSDEDGFKGAWYRASILESPPKSTSKKRRKALIQYKQLLADDGCSPLTEYIDPAFIRPLPPQEETVEEVFEVNDVVDANYRDGWWTGTVRKVLEDGRFRVYFDSPPDVIDFEGKDLRVHWEWVDGKWVRPEKQQQSTGSIFSSGVDVEVNIDNKENIRDVWYPATVIKENENGTFLVKYQKSKSKDDGDAGMGRVTVDSKHIRPTPPRFVDRNYELLEKVDTAYGFGWRAGLITKVLAGRRFNVFFKNGNEDKELSHSDIRPHVEWIDGNWIGESKELLIASNNQELPGHPTSSNNSNFEGIANLENSGPANDKEKSPSLPNLRKNKMEHSTANHEDSAIDTLPPSQKKIKLGNVNGSALQSIPSKKSFPSKTFAGDASNLVSSVAASQLRKMPNESDKEARRGLATPRTPRSGTRCLKKSLIGEKPSVITPSPLLGKRIKTEQQRFGSDFQLSDVVKRGRPKKAQDESSLAVLSDKSSIKSDVTEKQNQSGSRRKEAETPIVLGLTAKGITKVQPQGVTPDEELLKVIKDQKKNSNDAKGDNNTLLKSGGGSQRRKRGRPRKLAIVNRKAPEDGKQQKGAGGTAAYETVSNYLTSNEAELPALKGVESTVSRVALGGETAVSLETDCRRKEVDMSNDGVSNNSVDDDQPLATWIGGPNSSSTEELRLSSVRTALNGSNEARDRQINSLTGPSSEIVLKETNEQGENGLLPFVKKSPVWQTIESMEVFQMVPQCPHFLPLMDTKESYREGTAIGMMVTFASLFEKISGLKFDDHRSVFDGTLESLVDLEKHGFDVAVLRGRLYELLSIRDEQGDIIEEIKDVEKKLKEETQEKTKLAEGMEEISKKIRELEEQHKLTKVKMEEKDHEIGRLRARVGAITKRADGARLDFEKLAATPWK